MSVIVCKCGAEITPDEHDIQICNCGAYFRRKRGFVRGWSFAGWIKGGVSETEKMRQLTRPRKPTKRRKR